MRSFGSELFWQIDIHTYVHTYIHTYIQTDRQTDRQTGTDTQTDRHNLSIECLLFG